MLPKNKRPVEDIRIEDDSDSDNSTSQRKKARVGCLITSRTSVNKKSNSASSTVVEPSVNMGLEDVNMQDIDEDLHSRQLAVYGRETMRKLFGANVLISGMQGLGAEIGAKVRVECKDKEQKVIFTKDGTTDATGTYYINVNEDHGDETCDVVLVSSPLGDCKTVDPGRDHARVVLTSYNSRFANAMGFMKDDIMSGCTMLLQSLMEEEN